MYGDGDEALERTGRPVPTPTLHTRIVDRVDDLTAFYDEWDRLAVINRAPYSAPAWCLAWWRHAAPESARLRVVIVSDGSQMIAVAPFYHATHRLGPVRYQLLGASAAPRVAPLAEPGADRAAAAQITAALALARPRPGVIEFAGIPADSPWPGVLAAQWPDGSPHIVETHGMAAPAVMLAGNFEGWLSGKSRNFRQQTRRHRRRLADGGATFRVATDAADAIARLDDFERLHEARWRYRGGSGVLNRTVMDMLREVAGALTRSGRFQLWLIERDDQVISAHIVLAAGGEMTYWLGGFDEASATDQPSFQTLIAAIERGFEAGADRLDLGPGAQPYKARLSDHEQRLVWVHVYPPGPQHALAVASALPHRLSTAITTRAYEVLPNAWKNQAKRVLRRVRG